MDSRQRHYRIEYDSAVAMRYHVRRRAFLETVSRGGTALSLVFGTAAFAAYSAADPALGQFAAAVVAVASGLNLAFGTAQGATRHGDLFRKWVALHAEAERTDADDLPAVVALEIKRADIDGESPSQLTALTVLCDNEERKVRRVGPLYRINWPQRVLADWFTLPGWQPKVDGAAG